jgi:hypothetical protein
MLAEAAQRPAVQVTLAEARLRALIAGMRRFGLVLKPARS